MSDEKSDQTLASLAVGFTLGFGLLTVWEAVKQTRRSKNPRRSSYVYMIWVEVASNVGILILANLLFHGVVAPSVTMLFFILVCWVFEVQILMQIIINRIAIICETQDIVTKLKWGTAIVMTSINIAVFCIFIPAHQIPPVSNTYVEINKYWDRISKVIICLIDAGLNYYFLRIVKQRLLDQYGLMKYAPLVTFNARLMFISVALDVLLIGLMSLPNQSVFMLFHPLVYTAKLNIEMTMASLIVKLAQNDRSDAYFANSHSHSTPHHRNSQLRGRTQNEREVALKTFTESRVRASFSNGSDEAQAPFPNGGIQRTREFQITVHHSNSGSIDETKEYPTGDHDEAWLTRNPGHPRDAPSDKSTGTRD
ncbi:hypothetical protein KVR01_005277 [Diaporthe batatas]|uniref:uncharacterized protein n=1 Tax=Diaporthe batatas TaxID=748121 RepID=UPI001D05AA7D|nr:uncharacterized protein KVR01_005277 [Diaporthe batatas]KAG8165002.1 hypothetical protein KVR01_005277 [Diaporthe batatas]